MSDLSYLDGVEGVPGDDGADAAEAAGEEVLYLRRALLLSHGWGGIVQGAGGSQQVSGSSGRAESRVRAGVGGGEATGEASVAATLHHSQDEMDEEEKKRREKDTSWMFSFLAHAQNRGGEDQSGRGAQGQHHMCELWCCYGKTLKHMWRGSGHLTTGFRHHEFTHTWKCQPGDREQK